MCINFKYTYIPEKSFRRPNVLRRIGPSQAQTIHAVFFAHLPLIFHLNLLNVDIGLDIHMYKNIRTNTLLKK